MGKKISDATSVKSSSEETSEEYVRASYVLPGGAETYAFIQPVSQNKKPPEQKHFFKEWF